MKGIHSAMKRSIFLVAILVLLVSFCLGGFFLVRHILQLPFGPTNDALHKKEAAFTLDFLIPSGTYLDEKVTIAEVIKIRTTKEGPFYGNIIKGFSDLIPPRYTYLCDLILLLFFFFCYMTFLRVFTFMGYGRALRGSLLLAGLTYYFMPDFSPGKMDDLFFIGFPLVIILLRVYIRRRKKKKEIPQT